MSEDSGVTLVTPELKTSVVILDRIAISGFGQDKLGRMMTLFPLGPQNLDELPQGDKYWYRSVLIARNGRVLSAVRSNQPPRAGECAFRITHGSGGSITIGARDADDRPHGYMMPSIKNNGIVLECECDRASPQP